MKWLRWAFALLLTIAGATKLADMRGFYAVVEAYRVLPEVMVPIAAWVLAIGELALAAWLLSARAPRAAASALVVLHVVYFGWISVAALRGLEIANCGCFGVYWPRPLTALTFVEDAVLIALASALRIWGQSSPPAQRALP
jgi:uncharacterized membrane protein YphA (DoxX/SURF4 family)